MPDEPEELDPEVLDPNIRKALRDLEKRAHEAEVAKGVAERDAAFVRAGIPDSPIGQLFAKSYEGPYEAGAVKEAYDALGLTAEPPASEELPPPEPDLEAERRIAAAGASGDNDGSVKFEDAIAAASDVNGVMALLEAAPPTAVDFAGRRVTSPVID